MSPVDGVALFDRALDDPILIDAGQVATVAEVEHRVLTLARALPDTRFVMNLCEDRHHFLIAFCAIIASGKVNLLPPNRQPDTLQELAARYSSIGLVYDTDGIPPISGYPAVDARVASRITDLPGHGSATDFGAGRPSAHRNAVAAISFTSGSTGLPRANEKTWGMLIDGTAINRRALFGASTDALTLLATVPPQHMYGLELSVLMPMRAPVTVVVGQPLFPADVSDALENMPAPRALVTTPAHLRALLASAPSLPDVQRLFSATAPLDGDTAHQIESICGGELTEIYGCSEVGSIACRRTSREEHWQVFDGLNLTEATNIESGSAEARIVADHLSEPAELQDNIELLGSGCFRLCGRREDLINLAGKRGSLANVNRRLLAVPGVVDGVAFQPSNGRLAAFVVAPTLDRRQLLAALRRVLDPAFLPRPLVFVDALPRQGSSKLRRTDLLAMLNQHQGGAALAQGIDNVVH